MLVISGKQSFIITRSRENYPVISGKLRKLTHYPGKMEEMKYMNASAFRASVNFSSGINKVFLILIHI